jgi:predicted dinucleotide-binding enzyme
VFSVTHPVRWAFPDDPGPAGLTVDRSYFDRTPYVERDADGTVLYAEHHRTLGERVADLVSAPVAAGLHSLAAANLAAEPPDEDALVCGDHKADKDRVIELIDRIDGLRGIDAGRLETARLIEQLTPLLISINVRHKTHAGIKITGV